MDRVERNGPRAERYQKPMSTLSSPSSSGEPACSATKAAISSARSRVSAVTTAWPEPSRQRWVRSVQSSPRTSWRKDVPEMERTSSPPSGISSASSPTASRARTTACGCVPET